LFLLRIAAHKNVAESICVAIDHFKGKVVQHKFKLAVLSSLLCANAIADPVYLPPGQNLTYGSSSNNQSIMSSITNPAAAAAQLSREGDQYRFGILSIGLGYEFGNVNELYKTIDSIQTKLTTGTPVPNAATMTDQEVADYVNANIIANINSVTSALQRNGYVSAYFGGHLPFTPFAVTNKGLGGSFVLDANASVIANMSFINDPLAKLTATDVTGIKSTGAYSPPVNDSALLVKGAEVGELGLGYSRSMFSSESGDLTAGVRAKYYQVKLVRDAQQVITSNGAKNTFDASKSYTSSTGVGLDMGTLWTSKRYRAGAWINNINSPSFKYNTLNLPALGFTKSAVMSQISAGDTYKMKPQLEMEGAFYSESQNWVINAGLDANAVQDPVGRDFQWMTLSAAYATDSWWIPGARVGYRSNLAGSKLSYITGGLTMFKALSLDIAYGLSSVSDNNGKSIPRSAMINLGIQMTF
jgi:hypothetical protein